MSSHCSCVGAAFVTTRQSLRVAAKWCGAWSRKPPEICRTSSEAASGAGAVRMRVFLRFFRSASTTPSAYPRAITRSACGPATIRSTVAESTTWFSATMPPNADRSSHSSARRYAVGEVARERHAARVGVLDDGARGLTAEVVHELPGRVGVVVVEVREREAAVLLDAVPPAGRAVHAVARTLLVRVLAVAQRFVGAIEREHDVCG